MSSEQQEYRNHAHTWPGASWPLTGAHCNVDQAGLCATCADQALPARVLSIEPETGLALVTLNETTTEIDVSLLEQVAPGDWLLVHGGVALGALEEAPHE